MVWWDHEELKAPEKRSAKYKVMFWQNYSPEEVREAKQELENELLDAERVVLETPRKRITKGEYWNE